MEKLEKLIEKVPQPGVQTDLGLEVKGPVFPVPRGDTEMVEEFDSRLSLRIWVKIAARQPLIPFIVHQKTT